MIDTSSRFVWHRTDDGFVAYPMGESEPRKRADLAKDRLHRASAPWSWHVRYDDAVSEGMADTAQAASDAANAAWPWVVEEAVRLAAKAARAAEIVAACELAAEDGDATRFDVPNASHEDLLSINWHLRQHLETRLRDGRSTDAVEQVMRVVSDRFAADRRASG